ncbi:hypothetical protein APC22_05960 [Acinetobacter pittii]|nr:hypothetical protein APC19_15410 [Acinetobacter pittii]KQF81334.1 hypothetical protein APC22_05960 [Acinetobacter pittii]
MESSSDLSLPLTAPVNIRSSQNKNSLGYIGFFQFGEAALIDLGYYKHWKDNSDKTEENDWTGSWTGHNGVNSLSDFLKSPAKQGEFKHEVRQFQKPYDNQQAEQISLMV